MDLEALVAGWLRYQATRAKADVRLADAVQAFFDPEANPERAWALVIALVDGAPDELLGAVGAGPLEDVVMAFGPQLIARIEERSRRDPRFRQVLGHVWITTGTLPADVEARVLAASNGAIRPLPRRKQHWHQRR